MEVLVELFGRIHPLVVHLPIGFILMGLLLLVYEQKVKANQKVLQFLFFWSGISALIAVFSGLVHYNLEGYSFESVQLHLFFSLLTTLLCWLLYFRLLNKFLPTTKVSFFGGTLFIALLLAGHFGGNLTHGDDYLVEPLPQAFKERLGWSSAPKQIEIDPSQIEILVWYDDLINPLLQQKCVSCHNPKKTKGGLQLHQYEAILKGGEHGEIINFSNPEKSAFWQRTHLPLTDKKHMPPSSKTQFSQVEMTLLETWVKEGAPKNDLLALNNARALLMPFFKSNEESLYPEEELQAPASTALKSLLDFNLIVLPVNQNSNWLEISAVNQPAFADQDLEKLLPLAEHIVVLDLSKTQVSDAVVTKLQNFPNLVVLKLDYTAVTGANFELLQPLERLTFLHLTHTLFESSYLEKLYALSNVKEIYLFNSKLSQDSASINLPEAQEKRILIGNFKLPKIASDEAVY